MGKEFSKKSSNIEGKRTLNFKPKKCASEPMFSAKCLLQAGKLLQTYNKDAGAERHIMHYANNSIAGSQIIQCKTQDLPNIPDKSVSPKLFDLISSYNDRDVNDNTNKVKLNDDLILLFDIMALLPDLPDSVLINDFKNTFPNQLDAEIKAVKGQLDRASRIGAANPISTENMPLPTLTNRESDRNLLTTVDRPQIAKEMKNDSPLSKSALHLAANMGRGPIRVVPDDEKKATSSDILLLHYDPRPIKNYNNYPFVIDYLVEREKLDIGLRGDLSLLDLFKSYSELDESGDQVEVYRKLDGLLDKINNINLFYCGLGHISEKRLLFAQYFHNAMEQEKKWISKLRMQNQEMECKTKMKECMHVIKLFSEQFMKIYKKNRENELLYHLFPIISSHSGVLHDFLINFYSLLKYLPRSSIQKQDFKDLSRDDYLKLFEKFGVQNSNLLLTLDGFYSKGNLVSFVSHFANHVANTSGIEESLRELLIQEDLSCQELLDNPQSQKKFFHPERQEKYSYFHSPRIPFKHVPKKRSSASDLVSIPASSSLFFEPLNKPDYRFSEKMDSRKIHPERASGSESSRFGGPERIHSLNLGHNTAGSAAKLFVEPVRKIVHPWELDEDEKVLVSSNPGQMSAHNKNQVKNFYGHDGDSISGQPILSNLSQYILKLLRYRSNLNSLIKNIKESAPGEERKALLNTLSESIKDQLKYILNGEDSKPGDLSQEDETNGLMELQEIVTIELNK